jgi:hypothetical protein
MKRLAVLPIALALVLPAVATGGSEDSSAAAHDHLTISEAKRVIKRHANDVNREQGLTADFYRIRPCTRIDRRTVRCKVYEEGTDSDGARYTCRYQGRVKEYHTRYDSSLFAARCR